MEKKPIKLSDLPKKDVFTTPDGYFDSLQSRIDAKIKEPKGKTVVFTPQRWFYAGLAAAMIALAIVFGPGLFTSSTTSPSAEQLLASVPEAELLAYLNESDLEIEDILSMTEPELWDEIIDDDVLTPSFDEENLDLLYEQYGVSSDEAFQIL